MHEPLYERDGDRFVPSEWVRGPWSRGHCHAGPPAGLMTAAIMELRPEMAPTRVTCEIPGPIPIAPVRIITEMVRPGNRISFVRASMLGDDDTVYMYASGWLMRTDDSIHPMRMHHSDQLAQPDECTPIDLAFWDDTPEFAGAIEARVAEGSPFSGSGGASMWVRMRHPLLPEESWNPYSLAVTVADFPNGVAAIEPLDQLIAVNTDLTVYFGREPQEVWIGLRSGTNSSGLGLGMTESLLYDACGFLGTANQSIYFDRASPPGTK